MVAGAGGAVAGVGGAASAAGGVVSAAGGADWAAGGADWAAGSAASGAGDTGEDGGGGGVGAELGVCSSVIIISGRGPAVRTGSGHVHPAVRPDHLLEFLRSD